MANTIALKAVLKVTKLYRVVSIAVVAVEQ